MDIKNYISTKKDCCFSLYNTASGYEFAKTKWGTIVFQASSWEDGNNAAQCQKGQLHLRAFLII